MVTLITGVPGWVGTRLLKALSERGAKGESLRALALEGQDVSAARALTKDIVVGDLRKPDTLKPALKDVDTIFHLAAVLHSSRGKDFYEVNTEGTKNLLDLSLKLGVKRFIYASSDSAVGWNPRGVDFVDEETIPNPNTHYGVSKWLAEQEVNRAHAEHGLKTTIIRPCWIYGPGLSQKMVEFFQLVSKGRAPLVGKNGALLSMSYVDDVISGLMLACKSRKAVGETYYIAHERPFSARELYSAIAEVQQVPLKYIRLPQALSNGAASINDGLRKLGIDVWVLRLLAEFGQTVACSVEKAKQDLGYKPSVTLEEGIGNSIEYARVQKLL